MEKISERQRKTIRSLATAKGRRAEHAFVAEGDKSVRDLLGGPFRLRRLVATAAWYDMHPDHGVADDRCLRALTCDMERISSLSNAPDVLGVFEMPDYGPYAPDSDTLTVALDAVQDPGNLGTILRLCDWFGVTDVLASHDTVDVFNPKAVMATMGSISRVRVHYVDLSDTLENARRNRVAIWGTFLDGENLYDIPSDIRRTGIVVMGNEGRGISAQVGSLVSHRLLIPTYPPGRTGAESLNVAMATAITLAEFRRPR